MDLPSKLEKWAREMDRERWQVGRNGGVKEYDVDMVELSDLLSAAVNRLRVLAGVIERNCSVTEANVLSPLDAPVIYEIQNAPNC